MSNAVRIDRKAFQRGVEDIMTLAPLRDAVSGVFSLKKSSTASALSKSVRESGKTGSDERDPAAGKKR